MNKIKITTIYILLLIFCFSLLTFAQEDSSTEDESLIAEEEEQIEEKGKITFFKPVATLQHGDGFIKPIIQNNIIVGENDTIQTGKNGKVEVRLTDGTVLKIGPNTKVNVGLVSDEATKLNLEKGSMITQVEKLAGRNVDVATPTAVAGVRGTVFKTSFDSATNTGGVDVINGTVEVYNPAFSDQKVSVGEAKQIRLTSEQPASDDLINDIPEEQFQQLQNENENFTEEETSSTENEGEDDGGEEETTEEEGDDGSGDSGDGGGGGGSNFQMKGQMGAIGIDGKTYSNLTLMPVWSIGELNLGIYIPIYIDPSSADAYDPRTWGNADEWNFGIFYQGSMSNDPNFFERFGDFFHDLFLKFVFISYGQKRDDLFLNFGNISNFEFGHGYVVDKYTNMLNFPSERKIGIQFDMDFNWIGFETMLADVSKLQIWGLRLFFRPFIKMDLVKNIAFGAFFVTDLKPNDEINPQDAWFDPMIHFIGLDIEWNIFRDEDGDSDIFNMLIFTDFVTQGFIKKGVSTSGRDFPFGIDLGVKGDIVKFVLYKVEWRNQFNGFQDSYFDTFYDLERGTTEKQNSVINPTSTDWNSRILGMLGFKIPEVFHFIAEYQQDVSGGTGNNLHAEAVLYKEVTELVWGGIYFDVKDIDWKNLKSSFNFNTNPNLLFTGELAYAASEGLVLKMIFRHYVNSVTFTPENSWEIKAEMAF